MISTGMSTNDDVASALEIVSAAEVGPLASDLVGRTLTRDVLSGSPFLDCDLDAASTEGRARHGA